MMCYDAFPMRLVSEQAGQVEKSDAYRRAARRLRARHWNDPAALQAALCELVHSIDRPHAPVTQRISISQSPIELQRLRSERFRRLVSATIDGDILRYDHRRQLLRVAAAEGIDRFEANLLIAQAQHRAGGAVFVSQETPPKSSGLVGIVTAVVVQMTILAGVWLLLA